MQLNYQPPPILLDDGAVADRRQNDWRGRERDDEAL